MEESKVNMYLIGIAVIREALRADHWVIWYKGRLRVDRPLKNFSSNAGVKRAITFFFQGDVGANKCNFVKIPWGHATLTESFFWASILHDFSLWFDFNLFQRNFICVAEKNSLRWHHLSHTHYSTVKILLFSYSSFIRSCGQSTGSAMIQYSWSK